MSYRDYLEVGFSDKYEEPEWAETFDAQYDSSDYPEVKAMYEQFWDEELLNSLNELVSIFDNYLPNYKEVGGYHKRRFDTYALNRICDNLKKVRDEYKEERDEWGCLKDEIFQDLCSYIPEGSSVEVDNEVFEGCR